MNAIASFADTKKSDYTTAELRNLIRQSLGYNARQVTVSRGSSNRYLTITVRDAAVDIAKVKAFADSCDTWEMDNTDYCTGQSVNVDTTREVDEAHAAPFLAEVKTKVAELIAGGESNFVYLSNRKRLQLEDGEFCVKSEELNGARGCYIRRCDIESGHDWAFAALALQAARVA